jgi:hypothetical protein
VKKLDAGEYPLGKVFCSDFEFSIPDYQRPYSWGTEQSLQLLDDLTEALDRNLDEPYFLGSIVLVREGDRHAQVIDGQQRLTTLSLLFAAMRDLTDNADLEKELGDFVLEPGRITAGTQPRPRLTLRARDAQFFHDYVQKPNQTAELAYLDDNAVDNDSQRAIRDNIIALRGTLESWPEQRLIELAAMMGTRTFFVIVSTPDLASAHRIFSVMNARGLDLSPADIFKSHVVGAIDSATQTLYADKWEDAEAELGRDKFGELFLHIRMIFAKERGRRELLMEFPEQVLNEYIDEGRATEFVDDVLLPYADAYGHLVNQDYSGGAAWQNVNAWLARLVRLDNNDWRPPALWALRNHPGDPKFLDAFLRKLERLAASMLMRRVYATPRTLRYANLLKSLEAGHGLNAQPFRLTEDERAETRERLDGELYLVAPVRAYVLLRLDELLANQPGVSYQHRLITVEHVLPQTPKSDSRWVNDFNVEQRAYWTHRLANLVLLNRRKNSSAQRFDFKEKKSKYFTGVDGVATFALTSQVLGEKRWTPPVLKARQAELLGNLVDEWELI